MNCDVIMLQELDKEHFPALRDELSDVYEGRVKNPSHSWTNAIFYRKSKFKYEYNDSRGARTFALALRRVDSIKQEPILVFVNVHLEGNPSKAQVRIRQLEKQFRRLQSRQCQARHGQIGRGG